MSCRAAAAVLKEPTRTVTGWVARFRRLGLEGLQDKAPPGRPARLTQEQLAEIRRRLGGPRAPGNGRALSEWLSIHFQVHLEIRQCQRLLKKLLASQSVHGKSF